MNLRDLFYESKKLDSERKKELEKFCKNLNLHFKNLKILDLAFHHRSFSNENEEHRRYNNERLEFLGDSVLGLAVAAFLYEDMMDNPEGDLARIKANVVSEQTLAPIAKEKMHINEYLILGKGEEMTGGRNKKAILAEQRKTWYATLLCRKYARYRKTRATRTTNQFFRNTTRKSTRFALFTNL